MPISRGTFHVESEIVPRGEVSLRKRIIKGKGICVFAHPEESFLDADRNASKPVHWPSHKHHDFSSPNMTQGRFPH